MLPETYFGENAGEIKEDVTLIDLHNDIGKLRFSPVPYESSRVRVDKSSTEMLASDVLVDGLLPDFDSIKFDDRSYTPDFASADISSRDEDGEAEVVDEIDKLQKLNHPVIVHESSQRKSVRNYNVKANQNTVFQNPPRNYSKIPNKNSALDLNSLKISRRRRSVIPKQARSSVWGLLGNISSGFEENGVNVGNDNKFRRLIEAQGKKSVVTEKTDRKSLQKSRPTGHITLKIKIGNQSCGMVHVTKDLNESEKSTPDLSEIMENKFGERLSRHMTLPRERTLDNVLSADVSVIDKHLGVSGSVENSSFTMSSDLHQITNHEVGDNMRASTENRCSDIGTSPDSEVINSVPDATLFEKGLQNMQDPAIMPLDRITQECLTNSVADVSCGDVSSLSFPQKKSTKGKKKDKHHELGDCSVENQLIGAKCPSRFSRMTNSAISSNASKVSNGGEVNLFPELVAPIESSTSQASDTLIPCSNGRKLSKFPRVKEQSKSRYEILDITSKIDEASKKKSDKNNLICNQIAEKADASGASNGVESHVVSGNQTPSGLEETEYLSKALSEPLNSLKLSPGGTKEQYAPPRNAWVLCDECQKWRRIPAALADQIEETNGRWTCKDNTDTDFAKCSIPQELSNSEINKELEISDVEEDACDTLRTSNQNLSNAVQQPSSWSLIKSNLFLHRSRKSQTIDEVMVCHCKPPLDGKTGCGAKCLNRMLNIECVRGTCPCGELCSNQQFQKRKYAKLKWFRCGKKGFGLQALEDISHGKFLIEYVGEVLDVRAYEGRQKEYAIEGHKHFYFMTLNGSEVIDACAKGNLGRFINHSCDPNCRTEKWMVKGEVCVGLFAVRDIKKGEEVTFDYNYVRVFGAAAKKCVCGATSCRGYIGGDPTNSEVVQVDSDDEFAEPVMTCDEREMKADWNDIISNSLPDRENKSANELPKTRDRRKKSVNAAVQLESITSETLIQKVGVSSACGDGSFTMSTTSQVLDIMVQDSEEPEKLVGNDFSSNAAVRPFDTKIDNGEPSCISASVVYKDETEGPQSQAGSPVLAAEISSHSDDVMNNALLSSAQKPRTNKSQTNTIESKRKLKYATLGGKEEVAKPNSVKTHPPSSIKKGKLKSNLVNGKGTPNVNKPNAATNKSKHLPDVSLKNHVETVEQKLNELLDTEGGISKRKDASRGYLKLLFLTATSGTNGHGEAIQSTRDLSLILDAFLKTKSRTVLVDIIDKNGLQMLHNIMKRYRKQFNRTPILRKLLKVLEYLAMREILTLEHIAGGPPCPGVESFRDSILTLTDHGDRQVHQTARSFRDRFIPRYLRRKCFMEMDDCRKTDLPQHSSHGRSSISPYDHTNNRSVKPAEASVSSGTAEPSSATNCNNNNYNGVTKNRIRKRKSRWDIPAEENPHYRIKTNSSSVVDIPPGFEDDSGPPGFSSPHKKHESTTTGFSRSCDDESAPPGFLNPQFGTVLGNSQPKFVASISVSYGVPYSVMRQFGVTKVEDAENMKVAPGIPFHPFPPLPPCNNKKGDPPTLVGKSELLNESAEKIKQGNNDCSVSRLSGQKRPISLDMNDSVGLQRNDSSHSLGNKFFRQQKWSHEKQAPPPWVRMRNGWDQAPGNMRPPLSGVGFGNGAN